MGTHLATERAGLVTLHLTDGAPDFYPSENCPTVSAVTFPDHRIRYNHQFREPVRTRLIRYRRLSGRRITFNPFINREVTESSRLGTKS